MQWTITYNTFMGGRGGELDWSGSLTGWSSTGTFDGPWPLLCATSSSLTEASARREGSVEIMWGCVYILI